MILKIAVIIFFTLSSILLVSYSSSSSSSQRKSYIVYMGGVSKSNTEEDNYNYLHAADRHHRLLSSLLGDAELAAQVRLVSYGKSFDGFGADLLPEEAAKLREKEEVVSVFLSETKRLFTTWSWDYLNMSVSVPRKLEFESDIIIGVLDTGIYVDHPSFNDKGLGPPPAKWKGSCDKGVNFTGCNNKVIGARVYDMGHQIKNPLTPLDDLQGHGTHTASTAAGVAVEGANFNGLCNGTARGGVPSARLAIYKVCHGVAGSGCTDLNIMAAFDDAIHDGVDVISASLGSAIPFEYWRDSIAIGSFHAAQRGILVSASAGNQFFAGTIINVAPWILTVGASRTGKQLRTPVRLANGFSTLGITYNYLPTSKWYPITDLGKATNDSSKNSGYCESANLDPRKVKGKILYCRRDGETAPYSALKDLGAEGILGNNDYYPDNAISYPIPSALFTPQTGNANIIEKYINSSRNPKAAIFRSIPVNLTAPAMSTFSSRGPNIISKTVLKPDLVAPGVNILAAFPPIVEAADHSYGNPFNYLSGTSMACPHASGAAAYVKSYHPDWSPAAIKSALMTTARVVTEKDPAAEYAYGSALDPGLVYDMSSEDYFRFLCSEGYSGTSLRIMTGHPGNCPSAAEFNRSHDAVNYPTMNIQLDVNSTSPYVAVFQRTVTNVGVGPRMSTNYKAEVVTWSGMEMKVVPDRLEFEKEGEIKTFTVEVKGSGLDPKKWEVISGSVVWVGSSGHRVRSPVVVSFALPTGRFH
ncbi:Subtilisin-like protease SBT4.15 [Linum perenne]